MVRQATIGDLVNTAAFWVYPDPTLQGTEARGGCRQLPSTSTAPALDLDQQQVLCACYFIVILCRLTRTADGNPVPLGSSISFLEPPGHHWATQLTLNSFHLFPSVNLRASLIIFIAFL